MEKIAIAWRYLLCFKMVIYISQRKCVTQIIISQSKCYRQAVFGTSRPKFRRQRRNSRQRRKNKARRTSSKNRQRIVRIFPRQSRRERQINVK